jgi:hypothetical protein
MGEKIKTITSLKIKSTEVEIELNKESIIGGPRYIHIQSDDFRMSLTESEYIQLVLTVNKARKQLEYVKGKVK